MLNHQFVGHQESDYCIIFLHEGLGCIDMWKDYPETVCNRLEMQGLIYDRAGYGKSKGDLTTRTSNYLNEGADELFKLIYNLKIETKKIILYGHSDGGSIALIFGAKYPNLIHSIITEAAHVFVEQITLNGIKPAEKAFKEGKLNGLKKYHGDKFKDVFYAWVNIWNHPSFLNWNIESELQNIICPQLIIQGVNDQYGTFKQIESIKHHTKGNTTIFTPEECGHAPFKERRKEVMAKIVSFIQVCL
jgi:pimeloyl-ACP methyl ester carboxylesterase